MVSAHFTSLNVDYIFLLIYNSLFYIIHSTFLSKASIEHTWFIVSIIGYLITVIAFSVLVYASIKLTEIRRRDVDVFGAFPIKQEDATQGKNLRWQQIQDLVSSTNTNDWRQAIIESDIMLGDLLAKLGYQGESIGEKLRHVVPADFVTLNDAWEAHKVRNEIAHQGTAFDLLEVTAHRTIDRYENVFREFSII